VLNLLPKDIAVNVRNQLKIRRTQSGPKSGRLICPYCPNHGLINPISFIKHLERHAKGEYKCKECGKEFTDLRNLNAHMYKSNSKYPNLLCDLCDFNASTKCLLKKHVKEKHLESGIQCHICAKLFKSKSYFNVHLRDVHKVIDSKTFQCGLCGVMCNRQSNLAKHMKDQHTGQVEPLKCQFCGKMFRTKRDLVVHGKIHKERVHQCTLCPKKFNSNAKLQRHLDIHLGKKPFECPRCDYKSNQKNNIELHKRRHEREDKLKQIATSSEKAKTDDIDKNREVSMYNSRTAHNGPLPGIKTMNNVIHTINHNMTFPGGDGLQNGGLQTVGVDVNQYPAEFDDYDEEDETDEEYTTDDETYDKESSSEYNTDLSENVASVYAAIKVPGTSLGPQVPYQLESHRLQNVEIGAAQRTNAGVGNYYDSNHHSHVTSSQNPSQSATVPNIENLSTSDIIKQFGQQGDLELDTEVLLNIQKYAHNFEEILKNSQYDSSSTCQQPQVNVTERPTDWQNTMDSTHTMTNKTADEQQQDQWNYSGADVDYGNVDLSGFYQAVQNLTYSDYANYFDTSGLQNNAASSATGIDTGQSMGPCSQYDQSYEQLEGQHQQSYYPESNSYQTSSMDNLAASSQYSSQANCNDVYNSYSAMYDGTGYSVDQSTMKSGVYEGGGTVPIDQSTDPQHTYMDLQTKTFLDHFQANS